MATKKSTFAGKPSVTRGQGGSKQPIQRRPTVSPGSRPGTSSIPAANMLPSPSPGSRKAGTPRKQPMPPRPSDHMQRGTQDGGGV